MRKTVVFVVVCLMALTAVPAVAQSEGQRGHGNSADRLELYEATVEPGTVDDLRRAGFEVVSQDAGNEKSRLS